MQRRDFLNALLGAPLGALLGTGAAGAGQASYAQTAARPAVDPLLLQESPVAGFAYHAGPAMWSDLRVGDWLRLVREPANPYDFRAVAVVWRGARLGYVPRRENRTLSELMQREVAVGAEISALNETDDPWGRITMRIWAAVLTRDSLQSWRELSTPNQGS